MQKVLIISYFFPPCNLPASNRALGWAKHLSDHGYYPIIITRNWERHISVPSDIHSSSGKEIIHDKFENYEVYYLPFKAGIRDKIYKKFGNTILGFVSKIFTFIELIFQNYTNKIISYSNIYSFSEKYLKDNSDVKLLVVTANPFALFKFGYLLNKKFKIQWLADYRDDWNTSELLENRGFAHRQISKIEKISEKKWVGTAVYISSVSDHYCKKISDFVNKKGFIINNGFIEEEMKDYVGMPLYDEFTITFNGTLYQSQPIEIFVEAFKKLINERNFDVQIKLNSPGLAYNKVQETRVIGLLKGYEKYISVTSRIPKKNILEIQARSHMLLMVAHENIIGLPSSKLYEYIALEKPVLLCPSDKDIIEQTLNDVKLGLFSSNIEETFIILKNAYNAYLNGLPIISEYNKNEIAKYSRRVITKQLSIILDKISEKNSLIRTLILANDFPPLETIGAQRPYGWFKYFKKSGIYPVVITRYWESNRKLDENYFHKSRIKKIGFEENEYGTIVKTPYKPNIRDVIIFKFGMTRFVLIRKFFTLFYDIFQFCSILFDNKSGIYYAAKNKLKTEKFDVIIATGEPFILFRHAYYLSKKFNIPWIADYRDGWTTNYNTLFKIGVFNLFLMKNYFRKAEKRYVNTSSLITTTANAIKNDISSIFPRKDISVLYNGYFHELINNLELKQQNNELFEIAYAGTIYPYQRLEIFLDGLELFTKKIPDAKIQISFYGIDFKAPESSRVLNYKKELNKYIKVFEHKPQTEVLKELSKANLLLLLANKNYKQVYAKIFEYIALKRKIVLVENDEGDVAEIIKSTNAGVMCNNSESVAEYLEMFYNEFLNNGFVKCDSMNYEIYSREKQTSLYSEIIKKIVNK